MHTWPPASSDLHPQTRGQRLGVAPLRWLLIACASLIGALGVLVMPATSLGAAGITWTSQTSAADNNWRSVTYANGLFVAVAQSGSGNRVMTSPDGSTWTSQTAAADNDWNSVTYGNGLFVAVAQSGSGDRVMTSPDGITWTSRTSAADNPWFSVTYGNGLFVAVAWSGSGNRVMTSGTLIPPTPTVPVNIFTMKRSKIWRQKITTQLNLPGPGKVVQVGTTPLPKPRASSEMAKKARRMTVCTARKTVAKAGKVTITCRLTAKARAARKTHSLKVRLVTTFTPTGGTAKSLSTTLVLKKTR